MPTAANLDKIKLGACSVVWGTDNLGYTKGGVDVAISTASKAVTVDQFGESSVNEYLQGRTIEVTVPLAEHDLEKLVLAIPGAVLTQGTAGNVGKFKLSVGTNVGVSLRSMAKKLTLHPTAAGTDLNEDLVIPLAAPTGNIEYTYNFDQERIFSVTFKGFPDNVTGALFIMGHETVT